MTQVINETDKLIFILTDYGLSRVAEALQDPNVEINLSKIKIGDANYEYYIPTGAETELRNPIPNGSFYILGKELLEDNLTISLHTVFSENVENCEIREVGIYETFDDQDFLFAISTQQPLLKPLKSLKYFIAVDYYAFLKAQNLANIYDQIIINPDTGLVTEEDFQNLMSTILFSESNLMEQINGNTRVIGLNRARQLADKIEEVKTTFSYSTMYNNFATLLNYVDSNNLFAYWAFNYGRKNSELNNVTDLSINKRNLSTSQNINSLGRDFKGLTPMIHYPSPEYFYLSQGLGNRYPTFNSKLFVAHGVPSISNTGEMTDISDENYVTVRDVFLPSVDNWSLTFSFKYEDPSEVFTSVDDGIQTVLSTSAPNVISAYLDITQNTEQQGGQTVITSTETNLYVRLGDGTSTPVATLSTTDPLISGIQYGAVVSYKNDTYTLEIIDANSTSIEDTVSSSSKISQVLGNLILGKADSATIGTNYAIKSMSLAELMIKIGDSTLLSGSTYAYYNDMSLLNETQTADSSFTMGFLIEPLNTTVDRTLLARSDYSNNSHIFEVTEKADNSLEIKLFADTNNYLTFTSGEGSVPTTAHSLIFSYSHVDKNIIALINGSPLEITKVETGSYGHMNASPATLYAFAATPLTKIWADDSSSPTTLYYEDGTPVSQSDTNYYISEGTVYIYGKEATYNSSFNITKGTLYCWYYNDGLYGYTIYTKTLDIDNLNVILYNDDGSVYQGNEFSITESGSSFVVSYYNHAMRRPYDESEGSDIPEQTLYAFVPIENKTLYIWGNYEIAPSILYDENGDVYTGTDWYVSDNNVFYKTTQATASSSQNRDSYALPVISGVIGASGSPTQTINSNVGVVTVIKQGLTKDQMRSLALNFSAAMGENPCINSY